MNSVPLVDLIVGADLITTATMVGPGAVVIVLLVLAGIWLVRRRRR